jgi:hypothetical protein
MSLLVDHPFALFAVSFAGLCLCAWGGSGIRAGQAARTAGREELATVLTASLTLLGLIIGFSFSLAISRYDLRKHYEESEANAIQTAYLRADLLPEGDRARMRTLLAQYLRLRIAFFITRDDAELQRINGETARLQQALWDSLQGAARTQPDAIRSLVLSGMNEVFDGQGHTQAAWWNRIPAAAWALLGLIAILCNVLLGFSARHLKGRFVFVMLPLLVSTAFFLIADIDSPRGGGVIHIGPLNLLAVTGVVH